MKHDRAGNEKARQCDTIAYPFHGETGRSECRRSNVGSAKIVHDDAYDQVGDCNNALTDDQGTDVVSRLTHLRHYGEEGGSTGVSKYEGGERRGRAGEVGRREQLEV